MEDKLVLDLLWWHHHYRNIFSEWVNLTYDKSVYNQWKYKLNEVCDIVVKVVSTKYEIKQKKDLLTLTEIISSLEYKSESKASTSFFLLPLYTSSSLTLLL